MKNLYLLVLFFIVTIFTGCVQKQQTRYVIHDYNSIDSAKSITTQPQLATYSSSGVVNEDSEIINYDDSVTKKIFKYKAKKIKHRKKVYKKHLHKKRVYKRVKRVKKSKIVKKKSYKRVKKYKKLYNKSKKINIKKHLPLYKNFDMANKIEIKKFKVIKISKRYNLKQSPFTKKYRKRVIKELKLAKAHKAKHRYIKIAKVSKKIYYKRKHYKKRKTYRKRVLKLKSKRLKKAVEPFSIKRKKRDPELLGPQTTFKNNPLVYNRKKSIHAKTL